MEQKIVAALRKALNGGCIVPDETADWGYIYNSFPIGSSVEEIARQLNNDKNLAISADWNLFCKVCNDFKKGVYDTKLHKALS